MLGVENNLNEMVYLMFALRGQDNWLRIEMEQKWKARAGKPAILGKKKINFGTLGESKWEEELSTAAMRQF